MAKEQFPEITIRHCGGDTFDLVELFRIGIKSIDSAIELAYSRIETILHSDRFQPEDARTTFDEMTKDAVTTLATAITFCNTCPLKKSDDCTGMKQVDLMGRNSYQAQLIVNGVKSDYKRPVADQILENRCGITATALNEIHSVKMK